jgi:hypothetical protein
MIFLKSTHMDYAQKMRFERNGVQVGDEDRHGSMTFLIRTILVHALRLRAHDHAPFRTCIHHRSGFGESSARA